MESISNVINLVKLNVYMTSVDLKGEFFSVPFHNDHQKYLKFMFAHLFQFTSMPNDYGRPMRIFTKISKVLFEHLRSQGYNSVVYEAESHIQGDVYQSCLTNILDTVNLLRELGFVIHSDKLLLTPIETYIVIIHLLYRQSTSHCLQLEKRKIR